MSRYLPGTQSISNIGGNVGINTLSPSYTLDVGGNINLTGQLYKSGSTFNTIGGTDEQIIFNASGSSTGSNAFTFDKTNSVVYANNLRINNNSVPRKWYAFNSSFTGTTNPLQLTFNFDTPSFSANITSILNSVSITGATSCNKMDVIGGGYSSSLYDILVVNNVVSSNTGAINGNMLWDNTSNIVTPTTLQFSTTSHPAPDEIFSYYINVEMVNGRLISITDNSTPNPNFILYSY
jgi:hypothetical protein